MSKKWVLSIGIVLVLLFVVLQVVLQSKFISEKAKALVETRLKEAIGQELSIGHVSFPLFLTSILIEDLSYRSTSSGFPASFFAREIRVVFNPVSFFTETFLIRKIEIDSPELVLDVSNVGEAFFVTSGGVQGPGRSAPSVIVRSIHVKEGLFLVKGGKRLETVSLLNIHSVIRPNLEMKQFEVNLSGNSGSISLGGVKHEIKKLEGEMLVQVDKIVLKKGRIISDKASLFAEGQIFIREDDQLDLKVDLQIPLGKLKTSTVSKDDSFLSDKNISGLFSFHGNLTGSYPKIALQGQAEVSQLMAGENEIGFIKSDFSYQKDIVSLTDLTGQIFSGSITGTLEAKIKPTDLSSDDAEDLNFTTTLEYEDLSLFQIAQLFTKGDQDEKELLKGVIVAGNLHISGEKLDVETFETEGRLWAKRLPLFSPPLSEESDRLHRLSALFQEGKVSWKGFKNRIDIEGGELIFPNTALEFHGRWEASEGLVLETTLESDEVSRLAEAVQIPLTGRSKIKGVLVFRKGLPSFSGDVVLENGLLRKVPFKRVSTHIALEGRKIVFKNGVLKGSVHDVQRIKTPNFSEYTFSGNLNLDRIESPQFRFDVLLRAGNPQEVFLFFPLSIPLYTVVTGDLKIEGTPSTFSVKGLLTLSKGSLYGENFEKGRVELTVNKKEVLLQNAVLEKGESQLRGNGAIAYDRTYWLELEGEKLRIEESILLKSHFPYLSGDVAVTVVGKGGFKNPQFKFDVLMTSLYYGEMELFAGTMASDWKDHKVRFSGNFPERAFSFMGEVVLEKSYPFSFQSQFKQLQIDTLLKRYLSGPISDVTLSASGELNGNGKLDRLDRINLSGFFTELTVGFGAYQVQNDGILAVQAREGTFTFDKIRFKGENTALVFNGGLTLLKQWDLFLNGEANLNLITFFSKEVSFAKGRVQLDLAISDLWKSPKIRGQLSLQEGRIRTATLSQNIQIKSLNALLNERQIILETFEGQLGGGDFSVTGKAELNGFGVESFGFFLDLDNARINLAPDLPATVDGELFFQRRRDRQILKGDLNLKNLVYDKKVDLKAMVGGLREKKRTNNLSEMPLIGRTEINIHLAGDSGIQISNNIANIPLGIDLFIKGSFDEPLLLGRVDVPKGKIYFRKNTFRVTSGSVDFLNPNEIDPTFNMEASADVRNIVTDRNYKIDLNMSGTLSQITLILTSFPSLPEDDILALLAIGKTAADLHEIRGGAGTEATHFAVTQILADPFDQITSIVGRPVEELTGAILRVDPYFNNTESRSTTGTRVTAETRLLKERLLVLYSTTLDPSEEDLIRMVYEINKHISLVGDRDDSGQIGGDIRFRFEFR
ncbi:translocation/assembly module TamB [Nitrospira defluvii]|nr:translocation/assembly module TamB [Nitrospira defluvii]